MPLEEIFHCTVGGILNLYAHHTQVMGTWNWHDASAVKCGDIKMIKMIVATFKSERHVIIGNHTKVHVSAILHAHAEVSNQARLGQHIVLSFWVEVSM